MTATLVTEAVAPASAQGRTPASAQGRTPASAQGRTPASLTLATATLGFFIVTLDAVVVNVALPTVQHDLGSGISGLQWVVDGYTLMFAAFLLTSGVLSDRIGARRAFAAGVVVFSVASLACVWRRASRCSSSPASPKAPLPPS